MNLAKMSRNPEQRARNTFNHHKNHTKIATMKNLGYMFHKILTDWIERQSLLLRECRDNNLNNSNNPL